MSSATSTGNVGSKTVLWCVPRAISTAFAKCLSYIDDIEVWFEPYFYNQTTKIVYEEQTKLHLPMEYEGNEEIFKKAKEIADKSINSKTVADRLA